jgi:hypothetical protein
MQWQVSNFLHKRSHLHLLFSRFPYLFPIYFILPSCHASPPPFLPPLRAKKAQLNIAQNTPLQDNTTNRWATNWTFPPSSEPSVEIKGFHGYKIRCIWLIFTNNLKANRLCALALTRSENSAALISSHYCHQCLRLHIHTIHIRRASDEAFISAVPNLLMCVTAYCMRPLTLPWKWQQTVTFPVDELMLMCFLEHYITLPHIKKNIWTLDVLWLYVQLSCAALL